LSDLSAEARRAKVEAKPIVTIATCDGFRKGSTHPTGLPGKRPNTLLKDVHGIFGAVTIAKKYKEGGTQVLDCRINYAPDIKVPASYEGVSGGALWELFVELDGTNVTSTKKKLYGVAFRQSESIENNRFVACQGPDQIEDLMRKMVIKWPDQIAEEPRN
jgi:hypothetical protein